MAWLPLFAHAVHHYWSSRSALDLFSDLMEWRNRVIVTYIEPLLLTLLMVQDDVDVNLDLDLAGNITTFANNTLFEQQQQLRQHQQPFRLELPNDQDFLSHRRLGILPDYISNVELFKTTHMTFAALVTLELTMSTVFLVFLSCFYHNLKTSPLFSSPRRHRLPQLVPPALPVDGYVSWVRICFLMSDEEILSRIGFDSLIFLRFHRLALRCIVKMSVFSFVVLLPLNFTGGGHAKAEDLKGYVSNLFLTNFMRFTMANVVAGSPRLWVHCFAAYLLTAIVIRELLKEYETFNSIRHRYLLSREPHLRTVLVTNIPRHLRSASKIEHYFKNIYPNAVKGVFMCQNLQHLERLVRTRTAVLSTMERELLLLCRSEKKKLYPTTPWRRWSAWADDRWRNWIDGHGDDRHSSSGLFYGISPPDRLAQRYATLDQLNTQIEAEQSRRRRVMRTLDRMEVQEGAADIDYVLSAPFFDAESVAQRRAVGLPPVTTSTAAPAAMEDTVVAAAEMAAAAAVAAVPTSSYQPPDTGHPDTIQEGEESFTDPAITKLAELPDENMASRLRSRSPVIAVDVTSTQEPSPPANEPPQVDGLMKQGTTGGRRKRKKRNPFSKARKAIRQYGRTNPNFSILGKPINPTTTQTNSNDETMDNHMMEVTDKAFVTMRTFAAATIAIQSMHSSKPGSMQVWTAPEPRDILWENIYVSKGAHRTRSYLGEFVVLLIITFYIVPIALVSLLVSESALVSSSDKLAQLANASAFFSATIAMVQPLCIVGMQQLLPPLFMVIGKMEGITSYSEVQMRAFSRYFLFQVLNVFLVTTIAGSIFDTVAIIIENPETAFQMLGNSLPGMSSFFITFVTMKTFLGLGCELVRVVALVQASARHLLFPNATLRMKRASMMAMRAIDNPGWFPFHKILAQDMLVVVISVVFAVVAPLVTLPCALFCLCSRILWTHHHLYVYESVFESGGQFWPKIFRRFVFGLIIAQMTITGQFIVKEARHEAYATIVLIIVTYFFLRSTRARYDPTSSALPLEVATVMDISLRQDEEAEEAQDEMRRRQQQQYKQTQTAAGRTTVPASMSPREQNPDGGTFIGRHDPFRKAYIQPALRANPRARPEQPFPVAQLGPEDQAMYGSSGESDGTTKTDDGDWRHDSRATVRLRSMNQHDRKLIDRWWNDQLQRAGKQNFMSILIGEESGTLTISGPTMDDVELTDRPKLNNIV